MAQLERNLAQLQRQPPNFNRDCADCQFKAVMLHNCVGALAEQMGATDDQEKGLKSACSRIELLEEQNKLHAVMLAEMAAELRTLKEQQIECQDLKTQAGWTWRMTTKLVGFGAGIAAVITYLWPWIHSLIHVGEKKP